MPKLHTVIKLSYKEYTEVWTDMILTFFQQGMSNNKILDDLHLSQELQSQFALELGTVLVVMANLSFHAKPKMLSYEKNLQKLKTGISFQAYGKIFPDGDEDFLESCSMLCENRYRIFDQLCKKIYHKDPATRQNDLVGLSRYLVAQVASDAEENHSTALEQLGILLSTANDAFLKLIENSAQDTMQLDGKPSFSVRK